MKPKLPSRPHSVSDDDWKEELELLKLIIEIPDPHQRYGLEEFLADQPRVDARVLVSSSSDLYPASSSVFGDGVTLSPNTEYELAHRGKFRTDSNGIIRTVIVEDPDPFHPDLEPSMFASGEGLGGRKIIQLRSQSEQLTVFDTKRDGWSWRVSSCNRDPGVKPGAKLPRRTPQDEFIFGAGNDRGHLEEREAGGGPWGVNLDPQSGFSNTGKTLVWFKRWFGSGSRIEDAYHWLLRASGVKAYKGVVDVTSMREFEAYVKALVKLLPGRVSVITETESFTNADGSRSPSRVSKAILIDQKNYLARTACWRIEAGF